MHFASEFESLHHNLVPAERIGAKIFIGILSLVGLVVWCILAFWAFGFGDLRLWGIAVATVSVIGGIGWLSMMAPVWRLKTTRLREVQNGIELHRGRFWQHRIFIPRERIQHTDIVQGPIARRYGIASLVINTAGTHNHQITIDGLSMERAGQLRNSLLPRAIESPHLPSYLETVPVDKVVHEGELAGRDLPEKTSDSLPLASAEAIQDGVLAEPFKEQDAGVNIPDQKTNAIQVETERNDTQPTTGES